MKKDSIGLRLKEYRTFCGLTQSNFAYKYGINQRSISRYETGDLNIPDELKVSMAENGLSIHWLLTGDGPMLRENNSTSVQNAQKLNESPEPPETPKDLVNSRLSMSEMNLVRKVLIEKGILPEDEIGNCPVCGVYWRLNEQDKGKLVGYAEALLERTIDSVDIEDDDTNTTQNVG